MDADTKGEDSWQRCGELEVMWDWLYDMVWENVALESMRVACCPYGGPTAMVRDNRKMVLLRGATAPPLVRIFNCAGHEMGRFMWSGTQVVSMGWSQEQELLLVDPKGQVRAFSVHGRQLPLEFSLGEACETEGIADCCVYSSGVVVLTQANHIWAVTDINEPRPQRLADPPLEDLPRCMDVLVTQNPQGVEVILGCADGIVVADAQQAISPDRMLPDDQTLGAVSIIAISPNGEFVALFVESGALIVMLQDFTTTLLPNFTPPIDGQPLQMAWCGNDAIVLYYDGVLMLVSSTGDWVTFNSPEPVVLASEPDGLRVISTKRHRLLRSVDDAMRQVLSPESEGPGRQLFLARQAFDEQDAKADKILRGIKSDLQEAVQTCVEVAGAVWDTNTQRSVLKAACYGRAFCNQFPSHTIYEMCQKLRVLNAVRDAAVGWPLTMAQMDTLTLPVVISRWCKQFLCHCLVS
ncbi:unnamed protein product [Ostreobium quekettii]|uniref:Vps16 N-terminal domain-containing protein n=1 Tax=Ostreobium quekettii TaxID=121088 RepID=A0A8S1IM14_9CHLO|nr:unnamed protein product [Ostreobium quekettii]|eukprot:evm.model.scf_11.23 EVM.evm.TU.scf_11.23   scf_11:215244-220426(-)